MFGQAGTARKLRESHLSHTCRIVPKVLPGVYNAVAAVETPCSVRLWNRKMGILFGAIVGSGGGEFGMDRINDAAISFPVRHGGHHERPRGMGSKARAPTPWARRAVWTALCWTSPSPPSRCRHERRGRHHAHGRRLAVLPSEAE